MTLDPIKTSYATVEDYLRLEADSPTKHEYFDGEIVAMAGGTPQHSLIIANLIREVGNRLKGKPCRVYDSNLRIRVPRTTLYSYPDLSVICGEPQFDPKDPKRITVINPRVLFEVSSPSSEGIDRHVKFSRYLTIESVQEYVLVGQMKADIHIFLRQGDGTWKMTPVAGLDAVARLESIGVEAPLAEIYAGVDFPPESSADTPF